MARKTPRELIDALLLKAKEYLSDAEGYDSQRYSHVNKDGSVDAELRLPSVRGVSTKHLFIALGDSLPGKGPARTWIAAGARFSFQNEEDPYTRYRGLSQIQSHYRRYTPSKKALVLLTAEVIAGRVEKRQRKKVDSIFVRLHWNRKNEQPGRDKKDRRKKR